MTVATKTLRKKKNDTQAKTMLDAFEIECTKSRLETLHFLQESRKFHARAINVKLFESVLAKCENHALYTQVVNLVAVYRLTLEMFTMLKNDQFKRANEVLDEIESCLRNFDKHLTLPERKLNMRYIFS
jgi:hypothetical protein